jgi:hypothetical protein
VNIDIDSVDFNIHPDAFKQPFVKLRDDLQPILDKELYATPDGMEAIVIIQENFNDNKLDEMTTRERLFLAIDVAEKFEMMDLMSIILTYSMSGPKDRMIEFVDITSKAGDYFINRIHRELMEILGTDKCPSCDEVHDYTLPEDEK